MRATTEAERQVARYNWRTTQDAAAQLGAVSDQQVYEWISTGELCAFDASREPGVTRPDWRFRAEWLAAFELRRTRNADAA